MEHSDGSNEVRHREIEKSMPEEGAQKSFRKNTTWLIERPLYVFLPYLHMRWHIRVYYFLVQVVFFSLLGTGELFNLQFLVGKRSIFNQVFVKFGWGWTLFFILLLRLGCLPLHSNWRHHLRKLLIRITSLTFFFYVFCQIFFPFIEESTGKCVKQGIIVDGEYIDKKHCLKMKEHEFYSFDISGHSYLMSYCIFCLMEESKELIYVLFLGHFLRKSYDSPSSQDGDSLMASLSEKELNSLEKNYLYTLPFIVISTVIMFCLSLMWDVMLIVTTLYYHTFVEKVIGIALALSMWFLQYQMFFPRFNIL